ncbi:MAG: DUF1501 domain-containing protein [Bacteroidetes bacterium]|nr:MAG: DUF1501 domain-containing protein [Bacteroidota bacterium]TAG86307.1 MAG: DUF1501 domain-containing protein [Bacteroidota bacterium]
MNRRNFLKQTAFTSVGTFLIPNFLKAFEQQNMFKPLGSEKIVVVIQFSGGNDGLNTIVPFENDIYYKLRPKLSIPKNQILPLNKEVGLNPIMKGIKSLYDEGFVSVINQVGYPNPDRSHFRSMDIWQTASSSNQYWQTGWIGRYLDAQCNGKDCQIAYEAIEVDDSLGLALKGEKIKGLAVKDANKLAKATKTTEIKTINSFQKEEHDHENVAYLYKTLAETVSSADYIEQKIKKIKNSVTYPTSDLAKQLQTIAQFIRSGLSTNVYYASMGGFDTHVNQKIIQERNLKMYAEALPLFVKDLQEANLWKDVVVLTFSEFGRRVAENGSGGTDHGTANNVLIMNGNLKKAGVLNETANLNDLDNGDLKFKVDFRQVYATILEKHLQTKSSLILDKNFDLLDFL